MTLIEQIKDLINRVENDNQADNSLEETFTEALAEIILEQ